MPPIKDPPHEGSQRRIPRASQTPDTSWFGRRVPGERRETRINWHAQCPVDMEALRAVGDRIRDDIDRSIEGNRRSAALQPGGYERSYERTVRVQLEENSRRFEAVLETAPEPEMRTGDGWTITAPARFGGKIHAGVHVDVDTLDISAEELANVLGEAMMKLQQQKNPQPSALHPGARKRAFQL